MPFSVMFAWWQSRDDPFNGSQRDGWMLSHPNRWPAALGLVDAFESMVASCHALGQWPASTSVVLHTYDGFGAMVA